MKEIEVEPTTEKPIIVEEPTNNTCPCAANNSIPTNTSPGVTIIQGGKQSSEELILFKYNFENYIQNDVIRKRIS